MSSVRGSGRKSLGDVRRVLGDVWADILYAQRRSAELNTPWLRERRSSGQR